MSPTCIREICKVSLLWNVDLKASWLYWHCRKKVSQLGSDPVIGAVKTLTTREALENTNTLAPVKHRDLRSVSWWTILEISAPVQTSRVTLISSIKSARLKIRWPEHYILLQSVVRIPKQSGFQIQIWMSTEFSESSTHGSSVAEKDTNFYIQQAW